MKPSRSEPEAAAEVSLSRLKLLLAEAVFDMQMFEFGFSGSPAPSGAPAGHGASGGRRFTSRIHSKMDEPEASLSCGRVSGVVS